MMLADERAIDDVLGRDSDAFVEHVQRHVVVHMGTTALDYAAGLSADITAAGGTYVEAPVSGSKVPAEHGELVAMVAGAADASARLADLLRPMCRRVFFCGESPGGALRMKLAVNLYLMTTVAGLAEAAHFAERQGLSLDTFMSVVNAGQLASPVADVKGAKLRDRDFSAQAAIHDVRKNSRFVVEAARAAGIATPMIELTHQLYVEAHELGLGPDDMAAVVRAIETRTDRAAAVAPRQVMPCGCWCAR
jgi:3-hydroxyisobutyrate dehydrogenase